MLGLGVGRVSVREGVAVAERVGCGVREAEGVGDGPVGVGYSVKVQEANCVRVPLGGKEADWVWANVKLRLLLLPGVALRLWLCEEDTLWYWVSIGE